MHSTSALWLGRLRSGERDRTVRVFTAGPPPTDDDLFEEIDDPFADPAADPWQRAGGPASPTALRGRLGDHALALPLTPSKIIGVGRNFRAHAAELGNEVPTEPLLFFKPPSALTLAGQPIVLPRGYQRIDLEAELVVVIGRSARGVAEADALQHVAGYMLGNDVSCRDLQRSDKQWTRAKGFDTFAPISAFVRLTEPGHLLPLEQVFVTATHGARRCQRAPLSDMIFGLPALIAYISACMTLKPGDLIFTGTPEGVHPLAPGDHVQIAAEGPFPLAPVASPVV